MTGPAWERPGLADREGPLTEWQASAQDYRLAFGWPSWAFERRVWVLASEPVEALEVPDPPGRHVVNLLRDNDITAPVFTAPDPGTPRWVFLVERRDPTWLHRRDRLTELDVEHVWAGTTLHLPPSEFNGDQLEWITLPAIPLPDFVVVADAIIRAAAP